MLEIDEGIGWPELLPEFLPSHNLPGASQQHFKDQIRLPAQSYSRSALGKLTCTRVNFEQAEAVFGPGPHNPPALMA